MELNLDFPNCLYAVRSNITVSLCVALHGDVHIRRGMDEANHSHAWW